MPRLTSSAAVALCALLSACPAASIDAFTATPDAIDEGGAAQLEWSATGVAGCSLSPDVGPVPAAGSAGVSPTVTTEYTLTCGDLLAGATVTVHPKVRIVAFTATPASVFIDAPTELAWEVTAPTSCRIGGVGTVGAAGSLTRLVTQDTTYTLTCEGLGGPVSSAVTVTATVPTFLDAPTGLAVTPGDGELVLTWQQGFGFSDVYFAEQSGITQANVASLDAGVRITRVASPFTVSGLVNGHTYFARVSAVSGTYESALSGEASGTPVDLGGVDPLYGAQWHLHNTGQQGATPGEDIHVEPAWLLTRGEGTRLAMVDDGVDLAHEDLRQNIATGWSHDYLGTAPNSLAEHGTCTAGLAAARDLNDAGVRGVAPRASIVSYNLLQTLSSADELDAMTRGKATNSVSSNSWGDAWDGTGWLTAADPLWLEGVQQGATTGRGGLGTVYFWASGNGADSPYPDDANYDGQANSRYVIAVGGVGDEGQWAGYAEGGANVLISAPTEGLRWLGLTTTDTTGAGGYNTGHTGGELPNPDYSQTMSGTSASTPIAAGVALLMLSVRPELTWRDVRRVLAYTARRNDPKDADWRLNGAGLHVNHKVGFGVVDAKAAVDLARVFPAGDPEVSFASAPGGGGEAIPDDDALGVTSGLDLAGTGVGHVEFVEVTVTLAHPRTGDLDLVLTSPAGTPSLLHWAHRCQPDQGTGAEVCSPIDGYVFGDVRHLDEAADGRWTLTVKDRRAGNVGTLTSWKLTIFGRL